MVGSTNASIKFFGGGGGGFNNRRWGLREDFKLKENKERFTFCGKQVFQDKDGSIIVGQADAARAIDFVEILPSRRKLLAARCTSEELTEIRRVVGAVGWLARQTRPDLLAATSILAQSTSDPRVSHLVAANSLIKAARQDADFQLVFSSGAGIDIDDCKIL